MFDFYKNLEVIPIWKKIYDIRQAFYLNNPYNIPADKEEIIRKKFGLFPDLSVGLQELIYRVPNREQHKHSGGSITKDFIYDKYRLLGFCDESINELLDIPFVYNNLQEYLIGSSEISNTIKTVAELKAATLLALQFDIENASQGTSIRRTLELEEDSIISDYAIIEAIQVACDAIDQCKGTPNGFSKRIEKIISAVRGIPIYQMLDFAQKAKENNWALDLAGLESEYTHKDFIYIAKYAHANNIKITIHSGESFYSAGTPSSIAIKEVINEIRPQRIGHAVNADIDAINLMLKNNIAAEFCPSSNLGTGAAKSLSISDYPFKKMRDIGVRVSVNTDNSTTSDTCVPKEILKLIQNKQIVYFDDLEEINKDAILSAFIPDEEKKLELENNKTIFEMIKKDPYYKIVISRELPLKN